MKRRPAQTAVVRLAAIACAVLLGHEVSAKDAGWPREIKVKEARILVYQPQPDERQDNILTGRAAVSITPTGEKTPTFGTIWLRARMDVDREKREVTFVDLTVPQSKFPGSTPDQEKRLSTLLEKEIPKWDLTISLDRLVASLSAVEKEKATAEKFNQSPPKIVIEKVPALLVLLDGEPILRDIEKSELKRVVNTPYFLVLDDKDYWLSGGAAWFTTKDLKGTWKMKKSPPKAVDEYFTKTQPKERAAQKSTPSSKDAKTPKIVVATEPTELIVVDGEPKFTPITNTDLLYISNTKKDILMELKSQQIFLLLSGRWFSSKSLDGPWEYVKPDALPEEFKKIPEKSPKGTVLSSVPGTPQAEEAVMDAQVPQTAAVKRKEAKTSVTYDGEPQFKKIPDTEVEYAVNTSSQVLRIKGKYWVCDQAVWFVGDTPNGPWVVSDKAPPEVQKIPPDSPVYNTKYVYVYDSTPEVVYVGYMPGYVGCYPYYGTVVWGTGWYYPPYVSPYVYYPRPVTFGFSFGYNPYTGWSVGFGFSYGPFSFTFWGGGGYGGYYGPAYGRPVYGGGGNTINIGNDINIGGGGGNGNRPGGGGDRPQPKQGTNSNIYNRPENSNRNAATKDKSAKPSTKPAQGAANNVYSDRNGNVYQRSNDGSWQTREGNSWKSAGGGEGAGTRPSTGAGGSGGAGAATRPSTGAGGTGASTRPSGGYSAPSGLDRDYSARQRGNTRAQGYSGGGGFRGGGGGGRRR